MIQTIILETERLILRQFILSDTPFIIELLNSPGWLEFIGDRNVKNDEQAINYLSTGPMKSYEENGFGLSLVQLKSNGTAIGMCGLLKRKELDTHDIGFAFLPAFTGQGYAFEIAGATIKFAKDTLRLPVISAITNPENNSSIKLLEKIGLCYSKTFRFKDEGKELLLFTTAS